MDGITDSMDISLNKLLETEEQGRLACCSPQRVGHNSLLLTEQQQQQINGMDGVYLCLQTTIESHHQQHHQQAVLILMETKNSYEESWVHLGRTWQAWKSLVHRVNF